MDILKKIFLKISENIEGIQEKEKKYISKNEFYSDLSIYILRLIRKDSKVLNDLSELQLRYIPKFITAIYLLMTNKNITQAEICRISELGHTHIEQMRNLFGINPVVIGKKDIYKRQYLREDENLAEMIGIILGDGSLFEGRNNGLAIALNYVDEIEYVNYVINFMKNLFQKTPKLYHLKKGKGVRLFLYGKELIEELVSHGLKSGNKTENQVGVPSWITFKKDYIIRGLKGLFDTDGSVYVDKRYVKIMLNFSNSSRVLVEDFKKMCEKLDIKTSIVYERKKDASSNLLRYYIHISSRDDVKKFLDIIKPSKWDFRKYYIGINLIAFSGKDYKDVISNEISDYYKIRNIQSRAYSKDFEAFLIKICNKHSLDISPNAIDDVISKAFEFKEFPFRRIYAEIFKDLYEKLGNLDAVRNYLKLYYGISPKYDTIKTHIKKFMNERNLDFESWYQSITKLDQIVFKEEYSNLKIFNFPHDLRRIVLEKIISLTLANNEIQANSIIESIVKQNDPNLFRLYFPLINDKFKTLIYNYLDSLIFLVKLIVSKLKIISEIKKAEIIRYAENRIHISSFPIKALIYEIFDILKTIK